MKSLSEAANSKASNRASAVKKPRSPYILFFQAERQLIMNEICPKSSNMVSHVSYLDDAIANPKLPARYRNARIANPLVVIKKERRKHRKVHGKVGFIQLCQMIAERWKAADSETKSYFKSLAMADFIRFKRDAASTSTEAGMNKKMNVHSTMRGTKFDENFIYEMSSQKQAEFHQEKETNRWSKTYQQNGAAMSALQEMTEENKKQLLPLLFPVNTNEASDTSWNNPPKEHAISLVQKNNSSHPNSHLIRKRSLIELDTACNTVANKMFAKPLVVYSSDEGKHHDNIEPPSSVPSNFLSVYNNVRNTAFEQNMELISNNVLYHHLPSLVIQPFSNIHLSMAHPNTRPMTSPYDLHQLHQLEIHRLYLENLLRPMKF